MWAELSQYLDGEYTVRLVENDLVVHTEVLGDDSDEAWIAALDRLGYRPLPDTAEFTGDVVRFELETRLGD